MRIEFYQTESGSIPVKEFLRNLPEKFSSKIAWTLRVVREMYPLPSEYLTRLHYTNDIWEIRATIVSNTFRLLGFFDHSRFIILTIGYAKNSHTVPSKEIELAEQRKQDYYRRNKP